jgi:hypothetical protein
MRADEFISEEQKLDEVLPLVGLAAKTGGGMLAKGAAGAAKTGGIPNRGIGTSLNQPQDVDKIGAPDTPAQKSAGKNPASTQAIDKAKDLMLKTGAAINLPTAGTGGPGQFKISGMQGDEVEIENPKPAPGEPRKTVYRKDDIKKSMSL